MMKIIVFLYTLFSIAPLFAAEKTWNFSVSGDSRNCGDVVMPAIAAGSKAQKAEFYWHLGDFRKGEDIDEDIAQNPKYREKKLSLDSYLALEWEDFIENQVKAFSPIPVLLSIGNHEMVHHTREEYISTFRPWIDTPFLRTMRAKDEPPQTYYRWTKNGVDFISLDNASYDQFDAAQMAWFQKVVDQDKTDSKIKTIVVGMHEALPDSISFGHSMSESKDSAVPTESGRKVYRELLKARDKAHKNVYILASHSHFFMEGAFHTEYWLKNGGELPGWITGTAGAFRYPLPPDAFRAKRAQTHVYGYLLAKVNSEDGKIDFRFQQLRKSDVPQEVSARYGRDFVNFCFDKNAKE